MNDFAEIAGGLLADEIQQAAFDRAEAMLVQNDLDLTEDQRLLYEIGRNAGYAAAMIELAERRMFKGQPND